MLPQYEAAAWRKRAPERERERERESGAVAEDSIPYFSLT
jgi:hypothetical protein